MTTTMKIYRVVLQYMEGYDIAGAQVCSSWYLDWRHVLDKAKELNRQNFVPPQLEGRSTFDHLHFVECHEVKEKSLVAKLQQLQESSAVPADFEILSPTRCYPYFWSAKGDLGTENGK